MNLGQKVLGLDPPEYRVCFKNTELLKIRKYFRQKKINEINSILSPFKGFDVTIQV